MALTHFAKASSFIQAGKVLPSLLGLYKICTAKINLIINNSDLDLNNLLNYAHTNRIKIYDGWHSRLIGEIIMNINGQDQCMAEDWIKKAIEIDEKRGLKWPLAMDYTVYSDLYKKNGDLIKARKVLCKAIDIFKECGADGWVEKYEKELAEL